MTVFARVVDVTGWVVVGALVDDRGGAVGFVGFVACGLLLPHAARAINAVTRSETRVTDRS
jgi:predicted butyrate kinase (DUF1464 family)